MEMNVSNKRVASVYLGYFNRSKKLAYLLLLLVLSLPILEIIYPIFYKEFFDSLFEGVGTRYDQLDSLLGIVLILGILHFSGWVIRRALDYVNMRLQFNVIRDIYQDSFAYTILHSEKFFSDSFIGSLIKKIGRFVDSFSRLLDAIIWDFLPIIVASIGYLIVMLNRNFLIAGLMFAWIVFFVSANYFFALYKQKYEIENAEIDSKLTGAIADSLSNHTTVKVFTGEKREMGLVNDSVYQYIRSHTITWKLHIFADAIQYGIAGIVEISILYFSAKLWAAELITVGDIVLFQSYFIALIGRIHTVGRSIRSSFKGLANAKEMVEVLDEPHSVSDLRSARDLVIKDGKIEFKDITFRYNKTRKILHGFNLSIRARERVALVGPSGAGKSTIVKMLLRFSDANKGKVLIDGVPIRKYSLESLRGQISYVPQDSVLFHRSILENIRYGRPDASDEDVFEAAKRARAFDFIEDLPEKFDTFVGERGVKLSGGERQRVAIARAILADSPILILDEATSSLDSESEMLIQEALDEVMADRTTIVIAHRLSTIMKMDRILVIDHGELVDAGTHKELSGRDGIYRDLWEIQAGGFV